MGELGRVWLRGVGVTVPVTGGGGNNQAWSLCWPLVSSKIGVYGADPHQGTPQSGPLGHRGTLAVALVVASASPP
jgi:hypothetical protein